MSLCASACARVARTHLYQHLLSLSAKRSGITKAIFSGCFLCVANSLQCAERVCERVVFVDRPESRARLCSAA